MAVFKCKMCGANLEIQEGMSVCECEYCGTTQTLPKSNDDQTLNALNRANKFRQQFEFDKALEAYERILNNVSDDAEIYWSMVLCRYGIEYVDDPLTRRKIPTCHRMQYQSILEDADYQMALSHADAVQKKVYEEEAAYIADVQKGILEISNKEEPFDVFICYKESDENGQRTRDSQDAQDLYYQLTQEGFKVFFARITLEDKLGKAYEPYIFAALNSAKVMVVLGSKPEYFDAVWVRNEWSRFLMLMQKDKSRTLIPAYKGMDPYDLPEALSMFQAQDMGKIGFLQDLIRGIKKLLQTNEPKPQVVQQTVVQNVGNANIAPLLKRVRIFLEDGDWESANEYCEKVLDIEPECAEAYVGKLLVQLKVRSKEKLPNYREDFSGNNNYQKAIRYGDTELEGLNTEAIYRGAISKMETSANDVKFRIAKEIFLSLGDYADAARYAAECEEKALAYLYQQAEIQFEKAQTDGDFHYVSNLFSALVSYRDSEARVKECEVKALAYLYQQAEKDYQAAETEKDYLMAAKAFADLDGFKDSETRAQECRDKAAEKVKENRYQEAEKLYIAAKTMQEFRQAADAFKALIPFRDAESRALEVTMKAEMMQAVSGSEHDNVNVIIEKFRQYGDQRMLAAKILYEKAKEWAYAKYTINDLGIKKIEQAIALFHEIPDYEDVPAQLAFCNSKMNELQENVAREQRKIEQQLEARRKQRVCQHCGGKFTGLLTKVCTQCLKPKDY